MGYSIGTSVIGSEGGCMSRENKIVIKDFNFYYDSLQALQNINLRIQSNEIFAIFGPARSGKTTLLKSLNRLTDLIPGARHTGNILIEGTDIYDSKLSLTLLRRRIGMVFDLPIPLPMSIFENVAYGPKLSGIIHRKRLNEIGGEGAAIRCALGGGQGSAPYLSPSSLRRATAAPLYGPDFGSGAGGSAPR